MSTLNQNSATHWWPVMHSALRKRSLVKVPKTIIVRPRLGIYKDHLLDLIDGQNGTSPSEKPHWQGMLQDIHLAASQIGYPVFIRSDYASDRHSGIKAIRAMGFHDLEPILLGLIEKHALAMLPDWSGIIVRQWLNLRSSFRAFNGLPIAREFRAFVYENQETEIFPYWPVEAIRFRMADGPPPRGWQQALASQSRLGRVERAILVRAAERIQGILGGDWSIDFAQARGGRWYCIDMALAANSWHPGRSAKTASMVREEVAAFLERQASKRL